MSNKAEMNSWCDAVAMRPIPEIGDQLTFQILANGYASHGVYAAAASFDASRFQNGRRFAFGEVNGATINKGYLRSVAAASRGLCRAEKDFIVTTKFVFGGHISKPAWRECFRSTRWAAPQTDCGQAGETILREEMSHMRAKPRDVSERIMRAIRKGKKNVFR